MEATWPNPFDQPVHEWPTCAALVKPSYYTYYDTDTSYWVHPEPSPGDKFHTEFYVQFRVKGDATFDLITAVVNSATYRVPESSGGGTTKFIIPTPPPTPAP